MRIRMTFIKIGLIAALVIIAISLPLTGISHAFVYESHLEVVSGPVLSPNSMRYSPAGEFTAEIVDCGLGYPEDFPASVSGKIALIERGYKPSPAFPGYFWYKTQNAAAAGALAAIIYNDEPGNLDFGTLTFITDIPAVGISDVEGVLLLSLLASGPVTVHLRVGPYLEEPTVDVKPGVWPNTINVASNEIFTVAMCGTEIFDVTTIDPTTLHMHITLTPLSPIGWRYEDVATPFIGNPESGHAAGADGLMDLVAVFDTPTVVVTYGLADYVGETIHVDLDATTYDGSLVWGLDYVQLIRETVPGIPEFNLPLIAVTSVSAAIYLALKKRTGKNLG